MNENTQHAEALEKILERSKHFDYKSEPYIALVDLLTDTWHLAELLGLEFNELLATASWHHAGDVKEHGRAVRRKQDWTPRRR